MRVNGASTRVNGASTRVNGASTRVYGASTRVATVQSTRDLTMQVHVSTEPTRVKT